MRLVADANILVGEALRAGGRRLLAHPELDLVVAADAWSETEHELRKRVALLIQRGHLDTTTATKLLDDALAVLAVAVVIVTTDVYDEKLEEARRRIPRDPQDAPTVALALTLNCGIWTADRDFFGCGVPVWTTETRQAHLDAASPQPDPR